MSRSKEKPLHGQFEDELGLLVDRYLLKSTDREWMHRILLTEASSLFDRGREIDATMDDSQC